MALILTTHASQFVRDVAKTPADPNRVSLSDRRAAVGTAGKGQLAAWLAGRTTSPHRRAASPPNRWLAER